MRSHKNPFSATTRGKPTRGKPTRGKPQHVLTVFNSPGELAATIQSEANTPIIKSTLDSVNSHKSQKTMFYHGRSVDDIYRSMIEGDKATADAALAMSKRVSAAQGQSTHTQYVASPVGGRVSVPAYLAGAPFPMRRRVTRPSHGSPLSIVAFLSSSGRVQASTLHRRGIAIAALVQHLATRRPVDCWLCMGGSPGGETDTTGIVLVKFPTTPLDLTRLAYLLSDAGFCRGMGFSATSHAATLYEPNAAKKDWSGLMRWPMGNHGYAASKDGQRPPLADDLATFLAADLLYIPGLFSDKESELFATDSAALDWINDTIKAENSKGK